MAPARDSFHALPARKRQVSKGGADANTFQYVSLGTRKYWVIVLDGFMACWHMMAPGYTRITKL